MPPFHSVKTLVLICLFIPPLSRSSTIQTMILPQKPCRVGRIKEGGVEYSFLHHLGAHCPGSIKIGPHPLNLPTESS
jgi:hypothetical protein